MRTSWFAACLVIALVLSALRAAPTVAAAALPLSVPYVSQLAAVPGFNGRVADYACGPASAAMVAAFWDGAAPALGRAERLMGGAALIGVGSEPWQVAQAIRDLAPGVQADAAAALGPDAALSLIREQLGLGRPVVALVHPSWFFTSINHFVVVTGDNSARGVVTFQDPLVGAQVQEPEKDFLQAWGRSWHDHAYSYVWSDGSGVSAPAIAPSLPATPPSVAGATSVSADVSSPQVAMPSIGDWVSVVPTGLRVHAGPGADQAVIAYLAQGDQARVVAASNGWLRLRLAGSDLGWVNGAFLTAE